MGAKILIVDDDEAIRTLLKRYLSSNGYGVVHTDNGSEGLILLRESLPDLVLLDAEMPGLDGYALCRIIKKDAALRAVPVIMMSGARKDDNDVVSGLGDGADDYLIKPFALPVLKARVQALLRRSGEACPARRLREAGIELDGAGRTVTVHGRPVALTRKEFDLLALLIEKQGRVLSAPYLLETVWGYDPAVYNDPGTVGVHVSHLRKKLGGRLARAIVNVIGHGYKFDASAA